jgi:hypothetical protein
MAILCWDSFDFQGNVYSMFDPKKQRKEKKKKWQFPLSQIEFDSNTGSDINLFCCIIGENKQNFFNLLY